MEKVFLSVVIPIYNEEQRIDACFDKLRSYFKEIKYPYEIIFIDDKSSDNSLKTIEGKIAKNNRYKILFNKINRGKGYTVRKGMLEANGEYILFSDADFSTPIVELEKLLKFKDYPVVIGSRYLEKESIKIKQPFIRRIISRLGNFAIKVVLGLKYSDTQCGFKLFQNKPAKEIFSRLSIDRWGFDIEILSVAKILNYEVKETAVDWTDDKNSKVRAGRDAFNTFKELIYIKKNIGNGKYK